MAANYHIATQQKGVQVLGPTTVRDVQEVGIVTSPTGIYVIYPLDFTLWLTKTGFDLLGQLAQGIEQQVSEGLMVAGSYVQDYDKNDLLVDYCACVVSYEPGNGRPAQTTTVLVPLEAFIAGQGDPWFVSLGGSPASMLSAAYDALVATANA